MDTTRLPEFLRQARFWFALVNCIILFLPRLGVTLTVEEITAINLVLATMFQIAPPVNGYVAARRYELKAKNTSVKLEE